MINGISWLVVTKLDVLDELAEIPVCVGYRINGKRNDDAPAQATGGYEKIECIYEKIPGWQTSTAGITEFEKLPKRARDYMTFVEKETGVAVGMISTGPDRDHTIFVDAFKTELKSAATKG
jgi:adenylosuccinate synthase